MMDEYVIDDTIEFLFELSPKDTTYFLTSMENKNKTPSKQVPMFFYASKLFSYPIRKKVEDYEGDNEYNIYSGNDVQLTPDHLLILELLFAKAMYVSKNNKQLIGEMKYKVLQNYLSSGNSKQLFLDVLNASVVIKNKHEDKEVVFSLFSGYKYNDLEDVCNYAFSEMVSVLHSVEAGIRITEDKSTLTAQLQYMVKYMITQDSEKYLPLPTLLYSSGYFPENTEERTLVLTSMSDKIRSKGVLNFIKKSFGVSVDTDLPNGKEVFKKGRRANNAIIFPSKYSEDFFHAVQISDLDSLRAMYEVDNDNIEDEVERRVKERLEVEVELVLKKQKLKYIDFHSLEILQGDLLEIAEELGFSKVEATMQLSTFSQWYSEKGNKIPPLKLNYIWGKWLNTATRIIEEKQTKTNRDKNSRTPNSGHASSIVFNEEMEEVIKNNEVDKFKGEEYFRKFKNYQVGHSRFADNWVALFDTWVIEAITRDTKEKMKNGGSIVDENYYYALIIHKEVSNFVRKSGYEPLDIINGELEITEIGCKSVVVPPRFGSGVKHLLFFNNQSLNDEILKPYITKYEPSKYKKDEILVKGE